MDPVLGIDLGTTFSSCGVWINNDVKMLKLEDDRTTIPSYICFTEEKTCFGWEAKFLCKTYPKQTVFDVKRLIGRNFSDKQVQSDLKHYPFTVKKIGKDDIGIEIDIAGKKTVYRPEELSSLLLKEIKRCAEKQMNCTLAKAVITVPAYFNDQQRKMTKKAGELAGFKVQRIVNEPTAAALAYGLDKKIETEQNVLVFDLGGGTFDVSLLCIDMGIFEVRSTAGNTHLGGEDFDTILVEHCVKMFQKENNTDDQFDVKSLRVLRSHCEQAKIELSTKDSATVKVAKLHNDIDFEIEISRKLFESLNKELFESCKLPVEQCLKDALVSKSEIDCVVLIGGSTRIPGVRDLLSDYFDGKELYIDIDPDEAVGFGATVQSAIINKKTNEGRLKDVLVLDVLSLSLGVAIYGNIMTTLISRNSTIPHTCKRIFTTNVDNQETVLITVYEGERARVDDNRKLGEFILEGIPKAEAGVPQIEIIFSVDENGILNVNATELDSGVSNCITVRNTNYSDNELQEILDDKEKHQTHDEEIILQTEAIDGLKNYAKYLKNKFAKDKDIIENVDATLKWLEHDGRNHKVDDIEKKQLALESLDREL